jgi:hypothetical protein
LPIRHLPSTFARPLAGATLLRFPALQKARETYIECTQRGTSVDESLFFNTDKAMESICHGLGSKQNAGKVLGVKDDIEGLEIICNVGRRHAPAPGQARLRGGADAAIEKARAIVRAYACHLGLFDPEP